MNKSTFLVGLMLILMIGVVYAQGSFIIANKTNEAKAYFAVNGTNGKVGIGTAVLDSLLKVNGSINITDSVWSLGMNLSSFDPSASDDFGKTNYSSEYASSGFKRANVTEYIGVANSSILTTLNLTNGVCISLTGSSALCDGDDSGGAGAATGNGNTGNITYWTGSSTVGNSTLYQSDGLIGIGTTSPAYLLQIANVSNAVNLSGILYINGSGSVGIGIKDFGDDPVKLRVAGGISVPSTQGENAFLGLGSSTETENIAISAVNMHNQWSIGVSGSNGDFFFADDGTGSQHIVFQNRTGRVGIGQTSPNVTLGVSGDANVTGRVYENAGYLLPPGSITFFAGNKTPGGWLPCDGSAVSRTTYALLFATISDTYGKGDGATTFNLPDLRGRVPIANGTGTADVNSRSYSFRLNQTGGGYNHTLTTAQLAAHTHTNGGPGGVTAIQGGESQSNGGNTGSTGSDQPHPNVPPYLVVNCIIKT